VTLQAPTGLPFRLGSRQLVEYVGSQPWVASTRLQYDLRKVGYLDGLLVRLTGTLTGVTGSPDERPGFPYNIVRQFVMNVPGLAHPIQQSGYMMKIQNLLGYDAGMHARGQDRTALVGALANAYHDAELDDRYAIAVAANDWDLWWFIPSHRTARDIRGAMPIGGEQDTTLEVHCGALADIFDTVANVSATSLAVEVYQVFHTAPIAGAASPDTTWAVVLDEYSQSFSAVGDQLIDIPRDGIILNVVHAVWIDDDLYPPAPEANIESLTLRVNRDKLLDAVPYVAHAKLAAMRGDHPLPAGIVAYDFDHRAADIPFVDAGGERQPEWLFSSGVTEIESVIRIASGATLDAAKIVTSVKRLMRV